VSKWKSQKSPHFTNVEMVCPQVGQVSELLA
jgi:hypothetical protein